MKKKILIFVVCSVLVVGALIGWVIWANRNSAQVEAKRVLKDFSVTNSAKWYCENGAGIGFDNQTPWWEEVYVSGESVEKTQKGTEVYLKEKGYSVVTDYVADSKDSYGKGHPYWSVTGERENYSIVARLSSKAMTQNHCFKGFVDMNESINPENYNTVIVIGVKDTESRQ